jgi:antitoxin component of MazEF toxin-antitoxin module
MAGAEVIRVTVKQWGNSKGVVIPKGVDAEVGDELDLRIEKSVKPLRVRDIFGIIKRKGVRPDAIKVLKDLRRSDWK